MASASKNILWLSVSRIIALILLFLAYTQLFRYLGPFSSGQYQFVLSYVTIFGVIIDFGIQQYIIKKISEEPNRAKHYFHNFLAVEIILAVVIYAAMISIAKYNGYDPLVQKAIMIAGLGTCINGLSYPFLAVMSAFYDLRKVAGLNLLSSIINVGIIFVTIWTHGSIVLLAGQQVVYAVLAALLYYRFVQHHIGPPQLLRAVRSIHWPLIRRIFIAAFPFALLVGFSTIYNRIDVVIITKKLGYFDTGLYTAAYKFFDLIAFFPAVVSHSLYPVFASLMARRNLPEVRLTIERYVRFMIAIALPIGVGASILARPIIIVLAGSDYVDSAPVLAILAWAPVILFMYIVVNAVVVSQLTKFAMAITGSNVVVNIVGNLILLPRIGIRGAAIMTLVSEFLQGVFYFYFVRKKIVHFHLFRFFWQPIIAGAIMAVVVWLLRDQFLFLTIAIGALTYALGLLLLGFFKAGDIVLAKSLFSRTNAEASPVPQAAE
jgi:O-antigen/teichoic acid export membrane protein